MWAYPRPPRAERSGARIVVRLGDVTVVDTTGSVRVLETSHPPVYYVPRSDFAPGALVPAEGRSFCEYKGMASYLTVRVGEREAVRAAWYYPDPSPGFEVLRDLVALYPAAMDSSTVDGELVQAQEGWLLRRLDNVCGGRPVQGRARVVRLVAASCGILAHAVGSGPGRATPACSHTAWMTSGRFG